MLVTVPLWSLHILCSSLMPTAGSAAEGKFFCHNIFASSGVRRQLMPTEQMLCIGLVVPACSTLSLFLAGQE